MRLCPIYYMEFTLEEEKNLFYFTLFNFILGYVHLF